VRKIRFKALLVLTLVSMMLLTNLLAVSIVNAPSTAENVQPSKANSSPAAQSGPKDYASSLSGLRRSSQFSISPKRSSGTGTYDASIFSFNSFVKDLSSHKTDKWSSLTVLDSDSAEFVMGLNYAQLEGYTKATDLIIQSGGKVVSTVRMKGENIALVADVPLNSVSSFVTRVQSSGFVRYVEPNFKFQTDFVPNDPYWDLQWGPQKIEADYAWNTTVGSSDVIVAVVDTGIDYTHPDLATNYVSLGYDFVNDDDDPIDDFGHGTHVAGIIAAVLNNGVGIAGVAQIKIMAEKGLDKNGWGTEDGLAKALIHAVDQGADVLSNSWGGPDSQLIHDAIKYAYSKGALVVAAAGNSGTSEKHYPAAYEEVVAVTATDSYDSPAYFTTFGDWVEVAAPGVDIYSTMPTYNVTMNDWGYKQNYDYMSGTSMACPHVSGVAALILSRFPNMTRDWVRAQLRFTADDLGEPGFDKYYGYGRINARKAVEQTPPEHDLLIYNWQRPKFVQPGDSVTFNVTILNFGTSDELNLTVNLLVDGNIIDTQPIGFIASGNSDTVSLLWNPIDKKIYNVTVSVEPVPDETNTVNNGMSVDYSVQFIEIALFKNVDPWGSTANEEVFDLYGIPYAVLDSSDMGRVNLTKLAKIIIASDQNQEFYFAMDAYRGWFEDYVKNGGMLEIHAADWGWNGGAWVGPLPGGLGWYNYFDDYVSIVNRTHPVVNIPNQIKDDELDNWDASVHGFFYNFTSDSTIIMQLGGSGQPAYLEFTYGSGVITATSQTFEWAYMWGLSKILENSLLYFGVKYPRELQVSLEAPDFLEPGNTAQLKATVYNIGLSDETGVVLQILIDGTTVREEVTNLPSGWSFTMSYDWTPTTEATYNVTAYTPPVPDERFEFNNKVTRFVKVTYPLIRPIPGQWAYYTLNYYDEKGQLVGTGYWKLTYERYLKPYLIYIIFESKDPSGIVQISWMTVNIMNRWVEGGAWARLWYPGWVETNINIGSTINLLTGRATVNGSRVIPVGVYPIDCWELPFYSYGTSYMFWFDKASGLWIGLDATVYPLRVELRLSETNIPIGVELEHELAAALEAPAYLEPNTSSLLNATVYNVGLNAENNVKLSLLIDGIEVAGTTIPTLMNATSYTISYLWKPTVETTYNVTAYVEPVPDESTTVNNVATKLVRVRTVKGYILVDQTHWTDSIYWYSTWLSSLTERGYIIDTLTVSPITSSVLEGYDVFVIPQARNNYYPSEITAIQNFVLNGGGLLVIGDDQPYIYSDLTRFASITWDWGGYWGETNDITPHPVTEGVATAYFGSPGRIYVSLQAQGLIRDLKGNNMLAVSQAGAGAVIGIADEDAFNDFSVKSADNLRLANNVIDWLKSKRPVASFTYTPLDPFVGETVTFNASASYDPDGTIVSNLWDFGDGIKGEGVLTTHVYAAGGTYTVSFTAIDNEGLSMTSTTNVTVARTTLDVQMKAGRIYFRGEIAEFYVLVSSLGKPVDGDISAKLYYGGIMIADLSADVEHIDLGLYRIPYVIPIDASTGTYALVVEAGYLSLSGNALETFEINPTLTAWNAKLIALNDTVATIQTDVGTIKTDVSNIQLEVTVINGNIATIQTTLGTISGKITNIESNVATIQTDIGIIKTTLAGWTGGTTDLIVTPTGSFRILVLTTSVFDDRVTYLEKVVTINISGPIGTSGATNVIIPKQLLAGVQSSIDKIAVTIDDKQAAFIHTEQSDVYLVSIAYTHSSHTIKMYLAGMPIPIPWNLYIVAAAIIALVVIASLRVYTMRIKKQETANTK